MLRPFAVEISKASYIAHLSESLRSAIVSDYVGSRGLIIDSDAYLVRR